MSSLHARFQLQQSRAIARNRQRKWGVERGAFAGTIRNAVRRGDPDSMLHYLHTKDFNNFAEDAYDPSRTDGYAIRVNPRTGENEMFVRGTTFKRGGIEWIQNAAETKPVRYIAPNLRQKSLRWRRRHSKKLSRVARENNVEVIYGHSRGAAVVNDMDVPGATKVGLDGAMMLAQNKSMPNYRQNQWFDKFISIGGKNNRAPKKRKYKQFHQVWT